MRLSAPTAVVVGRGAPSIGSPSPSYRAFLATEWLPALDGVVDTLAAGGRVADVGCGHGASIVAMAQAFPYATFTEARP